MAKEKLPIEIRVDLAMEQIEGRFLLRGYNFPLPTPRDMAIYFWDQLKPLVREVVKKEFEQNI